MKKLFALAFLGGLFVTLIGFLVFISVDSRDYMKYRNDAMVFVARMISQAPRPPERHHFDQLRTLEEGLNVYMFNFWMLDEGGTVVESFSNRDFYLNWEKLPHPSQTLKLAGDGGPGLFFGRPLVGVIRLEMNPTKYLVFAESGDYAPVRQFRRTMVLTSLAIVILSLLFSVGSIIFYLRFRAENVRSILHSLREGNLKARISENKVDEIGGLAALFNEMASEIELLVGRLKNSEKKRSELFQELAHDLRTPIASTRSLLETASDYRERLSGNEQTECVQMALKEIKYMEALLDNLFFLAKVSEPKYVPEFSEINLREFLDSEIVDLQRLLKQQDLDLKVGLDMNDSSKLILADSALLTRMLRNLLENAVRFAGRQILISVDVSADTCTVDIKDDGPGFSESALLSYGKRNLLSNFAENRSLGSVVVRSVCAAHGWKLQISNAQKEGLGACVRILIG